MVESCDVGSLPFTGDFQSFSRGALLFEHAVNDYTLFFEQKIVDGFLDKMRAGIDVPNFPQYRDMTQMFFEMIEGVGKVNGRYAETEPLTVKDGKGIIPEVLALKNHSKEINDKLGKSFKLRMCVTGPYTLSSLFTYKDKETFTRLASVLSKIVENNIFKKKHGSVSLISLDEPALGLIDDPLLDRGSEARENLLKAWESIFQRANSKNVRTCLHLHNTSDELFWEAKALSVIESHLNDPLYQARRTKKLLESKDKFLKASVTPTDFDELVRESVVASTEQELSEITISEKIAEAWRNLSQQKLDPTTFLENTDLMRTRLIEILERFGENRVLYAGPECGLKGFPTYECALECLRRVSKATRKIGR